MFDAVFLVLKEEIPTVLLTKGMIEIGLNIPIQGRCVSLGASGHPLGMGTYIQIQRWSQMILHLYSIQNKN